jgi:hypothetical protein
MSDYNPATMGAKSTSSVGVLEAEFLVAIALLVMLMFADSTSTYSDRIMSLMKRGTLTCLMFFILSLVSSAGDNAAKIAKAFGGLIIIGIALTSPMGTVLTDLDNLIKNDWVGSSETEGGTNPASSNTGTNTGGLSKAIIDNLGQQASTFHQVTGLPQSASPAGNAAGILGVLNNALGSLLGKIGL